MWHAALLRLLRRRIVLAVIFCLSLTYFLVNLFGNVSVDVRRPRFLLVKSDKFNLNAICREFRCPKTLMTSFTHDSSHSFGAKSPTMRR